MKRVFITISLVAFVFSMVVLLYSNISKKTDNSHKTLARISSTSLSMTTRRNTPNLREIGNRFSKLKKLPIGAERDRASQALINQLKTELQRSEARIKDLNETIKDLNRTIGQLSLPPKKAGIELNQLIAIIGIFVSFSSLLLAWRKDSRETASLKMKLAQFQSASTNQVTNTP